MYMANKIAILLLMVSTYMYMYWEGERRWLFFNPDYLYHLVLLIVETTESSDLESKLWTLAVATSVATSIRRKTSENTDLFVSNPPP